MASWHQSWVPSIVRTACIPLPPLQQTFLWLCDQYHQTRLILVLYAQHVRPLQNRYRGFDKYLGLPYSVDMGCTDDLNAHDKSGPHICKAEQGPTNHAGQLPLPLYQSNSPNCTGQTTNSCNGDIIQAPVNFTTLRSTSSQSFVQYQNHKIELAPAHLPRSNYL